MKSIDGEYAKSKFHSFLLRKYPSSSIEWIEVPQTEEPPDYIINILDKEFAFEVTFIMEKHDVGHISISSFGITKALWGFVDDLAESIKINNQLVGTHLIEFQTPISNFSSIRQSLEDLITRFIKSTKTVENTDSVILYQNGIEQIEIQKLHPGGSNIYKAGPHGGKWEAEAGEEVCKLLRSAIASKNIKLERIQMPIILSILDAYHFASKEQLVACLEDISEADMFHTIYITGGNGDGFVAKSEETEWI